ncbi:acyl-CoA synthetase [soil metagenome]
MEFNLAQVHDTVTAAAPDRECIVWRDRRLSYAEVADRTRRLARYLHERGLGAHSDRGALAGHQSHQDHLALYLHNYNEYLEGMLCAYNARVAPFNVNYRYVAGELRYLLADAGARGIVFHGAFAPTLAEVLGDLCDLEVLVQVDDGSCHALLAGVVDYDEALRRASPEPLDLELSPDDLYIIYTGGTTGMPKGVLWRQADIFVTCMGGRNASTGDELAGLDALFEGARGGGLRVLATPPFMHGAGHWVAFNAFTGGHTVVIQHDTTLLDPHDVWSTAEREKVNVMLLVGDAFGRPLVDQLDVGTYDLSPLFFLASGGATLNPSIKERFLARLPGATITDVVGSSETGSQMTQVSSAGHPVTSGTFTPGPGACVVSDDLSRVLEPGHDEIGWLAQRGRVPLGYLNDPDKTARTFPTIGRERYSVPGDRARLTADGLIELYGRDSVTINSGGEKVFAEEVEQALARHPGVYDVVVAGRASERWGEEVVAVVQPAAGAAVTEAELVEECTRSLARFKRPKAIVFVDHVVRSPAGKADYRWARQVAGEGYSPS